MPYCQNIGCPHGFMKKLSNDKFYWTRAKSHHTRIPRQHCKLCYNKRYGWGRTGTEEDWKAARKNWLRFADPAILSRQQRTERGRILAGEKQGYCTWGEHAVSLDKMAPQQRQNICKEHSSIRSRLRYMRNRERILINQARKYRERTLRDAENMGRE